MQTELDSHRTRDFREDLASIVIPAFNEPDYLRRAIQSLVEQTYRPIEVIISDDCSPISLEPVVNEFLSAADDSFSLRYFRNSKNVGVMDNFLFALEHAKGKYLVPLAHDNRFVLKSFLSEALNLMTLHHDCHLCFANAIYEDNGRIALRFPESIPFAHGWSLMDGGTFIRLYRKGGMGWSQAIVLNYPLARSLKAFDEPFVVGGNLSRQLGMAQDNAFSYIFLLSALGSVAVCKEIVLEIGTPQKSYSRSDPYWRKTRRKTKFFIFYNIHLAELTGRYAADVKKMGFRSAVPYIDSILDIKIARFYHWHPQILLLMAAGLLKNGWKKIRYSLKQAVNRFRPGTFKKN